MVAISNSVFTNFIFLVRRPVVISVATDGDSTGDFRELGHLIKYKIDVVVSIFFLFFWFFFLSFLFHSFFLARHPVTISVVIEPNKEGIKYYKSLIDALLENITGDRVKH